MIFSYNQLTVFLLIIARIIGVLIEAPIFNSRSFPAFAKVALAIWIAIVLWFVTPVSPQLPSTIPLILLALIFEVALGFTIGFIINIIFIAVQSAGEIMDMQMGLSVATALDPIFGAVISIIGRICFYTAMIMFLIMNGHHLVLSGFHQSFSAIPAGQFANFSSPNFALQMIALGSGLWLTAIKLSAPIVLLVFLSDFSFGIVSRVAPQVNVFMLGFQVKPSLGLIGFIFILPFIVKYISHLLETMTAQLILLINNIK
jgi:flagellar biosynthetic protein FliR